MKKISWLGLIVLAGQLCFSAVVAANEDQTPELQHECTSWIVLSDLTKNNTNILHKNRDALSRKSCVIFSPKNSRRKWIAIGDGGQTAMGMTSTGLAGAMNSGELCINAPTDNKKKPPLRFFRAILDSCDTAAQAVEKCKELLAAGDYWYKDKGSIFFFLDAKEGYICEFTAKNFTVQHITSGFSVRANIWMNPGMQTYSRNTVSNYLDSAARMYRAYSGLNALLDEKGKIELLDIFELSRSHKMPKGSSQGRSLCFGATNSAVSMEVDREYPDVLSTIYAAIGHPRHTVYIPLPVCTEQVLSEMLNGKWDAASWKRLKELKLSAPIPEEWTKFEADSLVTYKKAQADARALLKQGKRAKAIKLLNDTASAIWNDGKVLRACNQKISCNTKTFFKKDEKMLKKIFILALVSLCTAAVCGEKYSVLVFGDTHYDSQDVRVKTKLTRNKKLELARNLEIWKTNMPLLIKAAAEKGNASADFAVQLGDLTQGDCGARELQEKSFRNVLEIFQKELKIPFYTIKGNHDIRGKGAHAAYDAVMLPYMSQVLKQPVPKNRKANFAVMHKGDLYIYFDCMKPDVDFVYKALEKYPDARYTFLLTHIPVLPGHNAAGLVPDEAERPEFLKTLAKRKAIVLCAHVHITTMIRCEMEEGDIVQLVSYSLPRDLHQEYTVIEGSIFDLHRKLDKPDKLAPLKPFFESRLKDFVYHRYGGGFNMLNVSDEGVFCDLYTGDMKVPFKTIKLR